VTSPVRYDHAQPYTTVADWTSMPPDTAHKGPVPASAS
jgi:hypothetical protein